MSDKKYCYPDTNVLINKLNIKDQDTLHNAERAITTVRGAELLKAPLPKTFDFATLKNIHKTLFKDIYSWAGKVREVPIAKSNLFCLPPFIEPMAAEIFQNLKSESYLKNLSPDEFISRLAFYMGEINALHPFREGNGRTQRLFFVQLARAAGYELAFDQIDSGRLLNADIESMAGHYTLLETLLKENISPIQPPSIKTQIKDIQKNPYQKDYKTSPKRSKNIDHNR